ncbi:MAG: BatA domain-containing protein [Flavobacteriaceae bacterium]
MQFKHPEILYFLALLLIPILVHLFQLQRFVKVPFTNVAFLQKLALQTRKSSRLKKWLILCTRLLGLLAIILAFSQPFFSNKKIDNSNKYFIYLDNSLSVNSKGEKGNLLKNSMQEIISSTSDKTTYSLTTNTEYFKNLSTSEVKNALLKVKPNAKKLKIEDVLLKISKKKTTSIKSLHKNILISDFQNVNHIDFTNVNTTISLVKLNNTQNNNISIDSIYTTNTNSNNITLNAIIKNQGEAKNSIPIALYNKEKLLSKQSFSIDENTKKTITFNFEKEKEIKGKISITFSDTFTFDNSFFFTINTQQKINVLSIGKVSKFLPKIYSKKEFNFHTTSTQNTNYNSIPKQQLIILNEIVEIPKSLESVLIEFCNKGGHLVIIPNSSLNINSYNSLLQKLNRSNINSKQEKSLKITQISYNHPFFKDVFSKKVTNFQYPEVNNYYPSTFRNSSKIISLEDNSSFLKEVKLKNSSIYWFSSPLNKKASNFVNSPLIVPVFYNFATKSFKHSKLYYTIDTENSIDINSELQKDEILSISNGKETFIPLQQTYQNKVKLITKEQPLIAGIYNVVNKKDTINSIAFNYPKEESSLNFLDINQLKDQKNITIYTSVDDFFKENNKKNKVTWLWKWFLALAIVSLLLEILILKFLKP